MTFEQAANIFENLAVVALAKGAFTDFESVLSVKQAVDIVKAEVQKQNVTQQTNHVEETTLRKR